VSKNVVIYDYLEVGRAGIFRAWDGLKVLAFGLGLIWDFKIKKLGLRLLKFWPL
jgi:hypothetical protein